MVDQLFSEISPTLSTPWAVVLVRLGAAALLCGLIGFERESENRAAGLRTHMMIGLASAVYCLLMLDLLARGSDYPDAVRTDPIRIIEAVTSGVAFLAAGMIVFSRGRVRGLTTGASMWLAAAIGLACALGQWIIALAALGFAILIMRVVKLAERHAYAKRATRHGETDPDTGEDRDALTDNPSR